MSYFPTINDLEAPLKTLKNGTKVYLETVKPPSGMERECVVLVENGEVRELSEKEYQEIFPG